MIIWAIWLFLCIGCPFVSILMTRVLVLCFFGGPRTFGNFHIPDWGCSRIWYVASFFLFMWPARILMGFWAAIQLSCVSRLEPLGYKHVLESTDGHGGFRIRSPSLAAQLPRKKVTVSGSL